MKSLLLLLRPHQWLKNLFVFLPLFFDRHILSVDHVLPAAAVFAAFCLAASGIYCFNDILDVEADRCHPEKCHRPIASGAVSERMGYALMAVCLLGAYAVIAFTPWLHHWRQPAAVITLYIAMNIAYCVWLKRIAIIDVSVIALGFVLRVVAGGMAADIWLSHWIVLMTFLLSLFLAFAKRRDDMVMLDAGGVKNRKSVEHYNLTFINLTLAVLASVTIVCYIMYTVSPEVTARFQSQYVYVTALFVVAGIVRYLQLTVVDEKSGSPTRTLMTDRFIHVCLAGWVMLFALIIYW